MYLGYTITLVILILILMLLWKEEKRLRSSMTQGLARKYWILKERRRFIRFDQGVKIRYNLLNNSSNFNYTKTANISKKGLCLLTYEKLKDKTYLDLEIEFPNLSKPVRLTGQIVWIKDLRTHDEKNRRLFSVGIRFYKINPDSEAQLLTHLNYSKDSKAVLDST